MACFDDFHFLCVKAFFHKKTPEFSQVSNCYFATGVGLFPSITMSEV